MRFLLPAFLMVLALPLSAAFATENANQAPAANQIDIRDYKFEPPMLTVAPGAKVTWVNHDDVPHTIVDSGVSKAFHSSALDINDTYSFAFTKPGTYRYFCTLHPQMVGTIVVAGP